MKLKIIIAIIGFYFFNYGALINQDLWAEEKESFFYINKQAVIQYMNEQWYQSLRIYLADTIRKRGIEDQSVKDFASIFQKQYYQAVKLLEEKKFEEAGKILQQLKNIHLEKKEAPTITNITTHYLGIIHSWQAGGAAKLNINQAMDLLEAHKTSFDSPEWHQLMAMYYYFSRNMFLYQKHMSVARLLMKDRRAMLAKWDNVPIGIDLNNNLQHIINNTVKIVNSNILIADDS